MPICKWLFLKYLRSKTLGQIQNLVPHRLLSRLKSKTTTTVMGSGSDSQLSLCELFGTSFCAVFGIIGRRSRLNGPTRAGKRKRS